MTIQYSSSIGFNFPKLLEERGLKISEQERQYILGKMHSPAADDQRYADAIFEGGGVRGIAFLGALRCCDDLGLRWKNLAGTSAGAITAAFLAAEFTIAQLEEILGSLDYMKFLSQKTSPLILNGNPRNDLQFPLKMLLSLIVARRLGQYASEPFKNWLVKTLSLMQVSTFGDIKRNQGDRELKVVVSDISRGEMLVLPDALNPRFADLDDRQKAVRQQLLDRLQLFSHEDFSVAEAVRLSMSIPLFFEPGKLGNYSIVDGGVLSNFPLWIYDVQPQPGRGVAPLPRWPTFGFRLVDDKIRQVSEISGPLDVFSATIRTMMNARDRYHLRESDRGRIINIDVTAANITPTQFNLSLAERGKLYCLGYESAKKFFLEEWNWTDHLKKRGFMPEGETQRQK